MTDRPQFHKRKACFRGFINIVHPVMLRSVAVFMLVAYCLIAAYKTNTKSAVFLYTNDGLSESKNLYNNSVYQHIPQMHKNKPGLKDENTENYKGLLRESKA